MPVRAAALIGLMLAMPAGAETRSLLPPTCEAMLAAGEFSTRFRVIDPIARVTACRMKGVIEADIFDLLVKGRVAQWSERCFTERERAYVHGLLRQATLQTMPFVSEANCAENLERLLKLPEPRKPR